MYWGKVEDGTTWSLEFKYGNDHNKITGHMAYPDPHDLKNKTEIKVTEPFQKLISLNINARHF